jgi:hypothetical protein
MQLTGSISRGKTAEKHNTRECYRTRTPENINVRMTDENVILENRTLEDVYAERFGAAAEAYSARQVERGHPERQISDYLEKVREDKKLQPMYEFVVQVGNIDEQPDPATAVAIYREWLSEFTERYGGHFAVKQAIVHLDEATPHMHLEVVPVAESGRGLAVQNSMNKAVKQCGFSDYKAMLAGWDEVLTARMAAHGIERVAGDRERQMGGVDIDTYRRTMRTAEKLEERARKAETRSMELNNAIADKEGDLAELDNQLSDVQLDIDAATERLESVQADLRELESFGQKGLLELGAFAAGYGEGGRVGEGERAAAERNRELGERAAALKAEKERASGELVELGGRAEELGGARDAAQGRVRDLERRRDGLAGRVERLRGRVSDAWGELVDLARGWFGFVRVPARLEWVCDALSGVLSGFERRGGMWGRNEPLDVSRDAMERGYDLESERRGAWAASEELEQKGWHEEPPRSRGFSR